MKDVHIISQLETRVLFEPHQISSENSAIDHLVETLAKGFEWSIRIREIVLQILSKGFLG